MKAGWTIGLDDDAKAEMKGDFIAAYKLFERLTMLIEDMDKKTDKSSTVKDGYDCPNWAYKQADTVGYRRALREIAQIISSKNNQNT